MRKLIKEVLRAIKPSVAEEKDTKKKIDEVIKKLKKVLPNCDIVLGGSGEKGTWLKDTHDFDIFVKFPKNKYKSGEISRVLIKNMKKIFKGEILHGSRDYFMTIEEGLRFEIVPILEIKNADEAENITDISPLHVAWVKRHKKYADDIRLTKQFFMAAKVYGAESYINGFSGYVCEILTVYYKGFENLVKAIARWKAKQIIDVAGYFKGKNVLFELDRSKTYGPLIVIDPVQESRNAAAAVSQEKFNKSIEYCRAFLKCPSSEFFMEKPINTEKLRKKAKQDELFIFDVQPLNGKKDIIGCVLLKCFKYIVNKFVKNEFNVIFFDWEFDSSAKFYFIVKNVRLPNIRIIRGPPAKMKYFVQQFRKKHKNSYVDKKYLYAKEKREFITPVSLVKALLKDKYIKEKVKSITLR